MIVIVDTIVRGIAIARTFRVVMAEVFVLLVTLVGMVNTTSGEVESVDAVVISDVLFLILDAARRDAGILKLFNLWPTTGHRLLSPRVEIFAFAAQRDLAKSSKSPPPMVLHPAVKQHHSATDVAFPTLHQQHSSVLGHA